jgi:tRNA(Ser,Leu) C12 N-acetylase TAN1
MDIFLSVTTTESIRNLGEFLLNLNPDFVLPFEIICSTTQNSIRNLIDRFTEKDKEESKIEESENKKRASSLRFKSDSCTINIRLN